MLPRGFLERLTVPCLQTFSVLIHLGTILGSTAQPYLGDREKPLATPKTERSRMQIIGWVGALMVVFGYIISSIKNKIEIFHWFNLVGSCILIPTQIYLGVPFAAFISLSFGCVAAYGLIQSSRYIKYDSRNDKETT